MKPAEKSEVEVVVVVVVVEVEVEKRRRRSITKRGNKIVHVERASAVRLFSLYNYRTTTTTTSYSNYNCDFSIDCHSIANLSIHHVQTSPSGSPSQCPAPCGAMELVRQSSITAVNDQNQDGSQGCHEGEGHFEVCYYIYIYIRQLWQILTDLQIERPPGIDIGNQQLRQDRVAHPD